MMMGRYLLYVLACYWYTVRLVFYIIHELLIFVTKPGARYIIPVLLIGGLYLARSRLDALFGGAVDNFWQNVTGSIIGPDIANLTMPFNIEIAAVAALILGFISLAMLGSILKPIMGSIWAPKKPLPPLPPLIVPNTEVTAVPVARLLNPQRYPNFDQGLAGLSEQLPDELKDVLKPRPERRRSAPTTAPEPVQRPTPDGSPSPRPQRPSPPPMPPKPRSEPSSQVNLRPAMPPKP